MKIKIFLLFLLLFPFTRIYSQSLDIKLGNVAVPYANEYIKSLNSALGVDLNSGLFHNPVPAPGIVPGSFRIYVGIKTFGTFLKDSDKSFNLTYIDTVDTPSGRQPAVFSVVNAPTFFGSYTIPTATTVINGVTYSRRTIGGTYETGFAPFAVPHIEIGTIYGTDLMIRALPSVKWGKYGNVSFIGAGIRHNISQYFSAPPGVDMAIQGAFQNFNLADNGKNVANSTAFVVNLQAFKSFSLVTLYGGLQYESFSTDITYDHKNSDGTITPIEFSLSGDNSFRGIAGFGIKFGTFNFNADLNAGKRITVSSGVGFSL